MATLFMITLLQVTVLNKFPSGSSLSFIDGNIYLVGDDATQLLVLNSDHSLSDSVLLFESTTKRIAKPLKADLEASAVLMYNNKNHLILLGSLATANRKKMILHPIDKNPKLKAEIFELDVFAERLLNNGIGELNVEGLTLYGNQIVLANRSNLKNRRNQLVLTDLNFWMRQETSTITMLDLEIPNDTVSMGVSDLYFHEASGYMFFTLSTEATMNAYDDGEVGSSFIAVVKNFSSRTHMNKVHPDYLIDLSMVNAQLKNQKIEGLCIEQRFPDNSFQFHLVADNDDGTTTLFKLKLRLP